MTRITAVIGWSAFGATSLWHGAMVAAETHGHSLDAPMRHVLCRVPSARYVSALKDHEWFVSWMISSCQFSFLRFTKCFALSLPRHHIHAWTFVTLLPLCFTPFAWL